LRKKKKNDFAPIVLKSLAGHAEFSEYLIALRTTQQLLAIVNLSIIFIFSSGLHGMTVQKIK